MGVINEESETFACSDVAAAAEDRASPFDSGMDSLRKTKSKWRRKAKTLTLPGQRRSKGEVVEFLELVDILIRTFLFYKLPDRSVSAQV